jgi:hypothetical protein
MSLESRFPELSPLVWRGLGATAFFGSVPVENDLPPRHLTGATDAAEWSLSLGSGASAPFVKRAIERYFGSGGAEAWVAVTGRGEGGGFGDNVSAASASGLYALAESEKVGVLALRAPTSRVQWQELGSLAEQRNDLLFVLERAVPFGDGEAADGGQADGGQADSPGPDGADRSSLVEVDFDVRFLRANVVEVNDAGVLCSWLEQLDFCPGARPVPPLPTGVSDKILLPLQAWRRCEGLRRSIDWGTRWLLFELHHTRVWRRAEREVYGFLYSLGRAGLVDPLAPIDVRCGPIVSTPPAGDAGRGTRLQRTTVLGPGPFIEEGAGPSGGPGSLPGQENVPSVRMAVRVALRQPYENARRQLEAIGGPDGCGQWPDLGAGVTESNRKEVLE